MDSPKDFKIEYTGNEFGTFDHRSKVRFFCWIPISIANFRAKKAAGRHVK